MTLVLDGTQPILDADCDVDIIDVVDVDVVDVVVIEDMVVDEKRELRNFYKEAKTNTLFVGNVSQ